jgi:hypothetical protein
LPTIIIGILLSACANTNVVLEKGTSHSGDDITKPQTGIQIELPQLEEMSIRPIVGWTLVDDIDTTRDLGMMFYGGFQYDVPLDENWVSSFSAATGYYSEGTESAKLGGDLEFILQSSIMYELDSRWSFGVGYQHISNANTHDRNVGLDALTLRLRYSF